MIRYDVISNVWRVRGRNTDASHVVKTAAALTFAVYLLCQHPHIVKRLREEIAAHVGFQRRPTYDDVRNMKYLRAFLNGKCPMMMARQ